MLDVLNKSYHLKKFQIVLFIEYRPLFHSESFQLSEYVQMCPSVYMSVCLSMNLNMSVYLSVQDKLI